MFSAEYKMQLIVKKIKTPDEKKSKDLKFRLYLDSSEIGDKDPD